MKGNASGDLLEIFSIRLPDHQDFLKMSAKVTPFSKISARRIAYFILFLTFVTFLYYQTRVIMESSALGFGRSYEGKELLGSVLYVTCFLNRLPKLY